jgi:hypothetical protein
VRQSSSVQQGARQCAVGRLQCSSTAVFGNAAVFGSAAVCGSVQQCERQCAVSVWQGKWPYAAVCDTADGSVCGSAAVCDTALGSVQQCGRSGQSVWSCMQQCRAVEVPNCRSRSNFVGLDQSTKQPSQTGL